MSINTVELRPIEPILVVRIFEPGETGCWLGDVTDSVGKQLASATAPDVWVVWDMLATIIEREIPDREE